MDPNDIKKLRKLTSFEALVEFSANPPVETRELNENIYLDLDKGGRVVSMTIEHASQSAGMEEFMFQRIPAEVTAS